MNKNAPVNFGHLEIILSGVTKHLHERQVAVEAKLKLRDAELAEIKQRLRALETLFDDAIQPAAKGMRLFQ